MGNVYNSSSGGIGFAGLLTIVFITLKLLNKIDWSWLSGNPNALSLLEQNQDKICWNYLSGNKNAIHLLEQNLDKIKWYNLSRNKKAIHILEQNIDKINWYYLSCNENIFEEFNMINCLK